MWDEEADRLSEGTREFAQAILGRRVPSRNPEVIAREKLAQLEWLATFSPRYEEELRRLVREEAAAREKQEHLAWLASISAVNEAVWDPAKHPRGGFSQNRGWFSTTRGASGSGEEETPSYSFGGKQRPSIADSVLARNRAVAELTGTVTPDMVRSSRAAIDIKSALELPRQVLGAFASGTGTGGKAVVNGSATAVVNVVSLGLNNRQLELIGVTDTDRENGYDTAVSIATASGEVLITVGTGGVASALAKGGTIAQNAGGILVAYDAAGNAVGVVRGTYDAAKNGVNLQNGLTVGAAALGLAANYKGSGTKTLAAGKEELAIFRVDTHGEMPSPRPGKHSHHGVMSAWMEKNFPGYDAKKAPALLMPDKNHLATYGVYNRWRSEARHRMNGKFNWSKVSKSEMRELSEKLFDAADVPSEIRAQYWSEFDRMTKKLKK